ncbi:MAG: sugar-binding protein, partial [Planctomycetota bacterium]
GGAAYDDTTLIFASPKANEAGQLAWCVKQHKGTTNEPTLASSNKSFAKISKKDRQENALTIWANVDQAFADLKKMLPEDQIPQQIRTADNLVDLESVDDLIASLSIREDGIALEANVGLKGGHRCVAYDLIRTPNLSEAAFRAVPSEAIALISVALGGAESAQAQMVSAKISDLTGLKIGGDVFANIDQITLFAVPPVGTSNENLSAIPPIVASLGAVISSDNPQQTRRILTGLLTAAGLVANQSADEQNAGRYRIELVNKLTLCCYADQASGTTVLSLNPDVVEAAASAIKNGKSVTSAGPLRETVNRLSPATSKLALVNVGGMIRAGGAYFLLGMMDSNSGVDELLAQLAESCDKTILQFRTSEQQNNFNVRAEISGLPPVSQVLGPIRQLSQVVSDAKVRARKEASEAGIPAGIRKASRPPAIDGTAEDLWSDAREYELRNVIYSQPSSEADFSGSFRAMWDVDNLYLLVDVADDSLKNDSDEYWLDDGVEVFIDADNSKSDDYGDNDYQYYFEWAEANPGMGEFKHGRITGVEFAIERVEAGYRAEIKLPWSTLGTKPSVGAKIGLDVHVNDDDDGGDRDTKITWYGKEDNAWQNPEAFGTAELAGLIGWWKFDGDANDSSGNANHGTENGDPSYVAGKFGQAISFDGDGDRVEVPATVADNPALYLSTSISASAWVKTTVSADELHSLMRHEFHFTPLQTFGGRARAAAFVDQDGSMVLHITSFDWSKINDGKWHHYAVTYSNGIHEVWIDGTKEVSNNVGAFSLWTRDNQPWVFGGKERGEGGGEHYSGELDDVRIYNYALSDAEITALYSEDK